ncbi:unnamed protein product [Pleuronectes platessa]|uniref:Uncharacterized protein n=1 Tax=Pleuronectes platessa TaxID=8262 RepID=A0A9N7W5U0_PLEPL|nr:unnamed protein product [Pleuronectes platessa]
MGLMWVQSCGIWYLHSSLLTSRQHQKVFENTSRNISSASFSFFMFVFMLHTSAVSRYIRAGRFQGKRLDFGASLKTAKLNSSCS